MAWFRSKGERPEAVDLVAVPVGYERTAATLIVARCEAAGIPARLLTMDDNGLAPGIVALTEHRLLVRRSDLERVSILVRSVIDI
jgi:hypothetical protein